MKTLFEKMRQNRYRRVQLEQNRRWQIGDQKAAMEMRMTLGQANMLGQQSAQAYGQNDQGFGSSDPFQ